MAGSVLNSSSVLRLNFCEKMNICASISATSPSCKTLGAISKKHIAEMTLKKDFEIDIKRISNIHFSAQETFLIVKELYNQDEVSDDEVYIKNMYSFMHYCKIYFWRSTVLELAKLFNDNDNESFNILKFIRKLKPDGHYRKFGFENTSLDNLLQRINDKKNSIENLIEQRNKMYAHDDRNIEGLFNTLSFNDTEDLLSICKDLIQMVYNKHFETHIMFEPINSPVQNLKFVLEHIIKANKIAEQEHQEMIKNFLK